MGERRVCELCGRGGVKQFVVMFPKDPTSNKWRCSGREQCAVRQAQNLPGGHLRRDAPLPTPAAFDALLARIEELEAERDRLAFYEPCDPCKAEDHANCTGACTSMCCALAMSEEAVDAAEAQVRKLREALGKIHRPETIPMIASACANGDCAHEDECPPVDTAEVCSECWNLWTQDGRDDECTVEQELRWPCATAKALAALAEDTELPVEPPLPCICEGPEEPAICLEENCPFCTALGSSEEHCPRCPCCGSAAVPVEPQVEASEE